jgi:tetratricopeptide (TPR) repeat protein
MLQGYRTFSGSVADGAVVKIQRLRLGEGMSISIESLSAPVSAQKAYQAGESDLRKRQWPEAVQHLRVAVTLYPKYALAWSELSRALEEEGLFEEERASLNEARRIDPKYIKPIVQLAGLASRQHRWEDEMRFCKEAFSLYAVDFPMAFTIEPKLHTT